MIYIYILDIYIYIILYILNIYIYICVYRKIHLEIQKWRCFPEMHWIFRWYIMGIQWDFAGFQ